MFEWKINARNNRFSIRVEGIEAAFGVFNPFDDIDLVIYVGTLLADAAKHYRAGHRSAIETVRTIWSDDRIHMLHIQSEAGNAYGIEVLNLIAKGPEPTEVPSGD